MPATPLIQGTTTIVWGTSSGTANTILQTINGTVATATLAVVTLVRERSLVNVIKLPQGAGLTCARVTIHDGTQWEVTVRDDTTMNKPRIGTFVTIYDRAGLISAPGSVYTATVVDANYDIAASQAGEFTITVENLRLIEGGTYS